MNVHFPGFGTRWAFWVILGIMLAVIAGMLAYFRRRRWL
jgi:LPXTG-motif cell wall-anchored protein